MSEQPNEQNNQPPIEKLLIDNPSNFQFHAAYMVYSEAFDKTTDAEARDELNQNIQELQESKINFETFYGNISRYRKLDTPRQERFSMQTQRKKDWRKKTQRQERIKRHKK
jgi:molybdopterin/thiamine biosynthesis adenylyltransferase